MTTRDSTRRELQDLAKLAATMPKGGAPHFPPPPTPAGRPTLQRPPTPSSISKLTVPPSVATVPPPSARAQAAAPVAKRRSRGGLVAASAVLGLAVAIAGGVQLGKYFARRGQPVAASVAAAGAPTQDLPAPPPVVPAVPAAAPAPVTTAAPVAVAATTPPTVPAIKTLPAVRVAQPVQHGWQRRAAARAPVAAPVPTTASTGMDPLEMAIRKSVATSQAK